MAAWIARTEKVPVSHHEVAALWRRAGLKPHRQGTFKISRDPLPAEKVTDIVGPYLEPPGGAVVLSVDEKTQVQALDRTQPLLPIAVGATEKRTHGYVRHGTINLFAALNVGTGEVFGRCTPGRDGVAFLAFLKRAVAPHRGKEIHVVLDNLATHTTPEVQDWLADHPLVHFHFTPIGSSWLNLIETWFSITTRQSIRRGTFSSAQGLIRQIRDYINRRSADPKPFTWTATADEPLAKVNSSKTNTKATLRQEQRVRTTELP